MLTIKKMKIGRLRIFLFGLAVFSALIISLPKPVSADLPAFSAALTASPGSASGSSPVPVTLTAVAWGNALWDIIIQSYAGLAYTYNYNSYSSIHGAQITLSFDCNGDQIIDATQYYDDWIYIGSSNWTNYWTRNGYGGAAVYGAAQYNYGPPVNWNASIGQVSQVCNYTSNNNIATVYVRVVWTQNASDRYVRRYGYPVIYDQTSSATISLPVSVCTLTNGGWSDWSYGSWYNVGSCGSYSSCQQRQDRALTRTCSNPYPSCGGASCSGSSSDTQTQYVSCGAVSGGWSDWSYGSWSNVGGCGSYSSCQQRQDRALTRTCSNPYPSCGGASCSGSSSDTQTQYVSCGTVSGGWSGWYNVGGCGSYSSCQQRQDRYCANPSPSCGGAYCSGASTQYLSCGAVSGGWSDWSSWSTCSVSCGGGTQTRTRGCTSPAPQCGGSSCSGSSSQSQPCNNQACVQSLSVSKSGTGSGRVTSNPGGINCGSSCSNNFNSGSTVALSASPDSGSVFGGWSGAGCSGTGSCSVLTDSAKSATAAFYAQPSGSIFANGSGGSISIPYNTSATISWSSSNTTSCSVSPTGWTGTSGSYSTGNLTSSRTYTISCSGPGGSLSGSVAVYVGSAPSVSIKANGSAGSISIPYNTSATVSWTSSDTTSCSVSPTGWTGTSGSYSTGNLTGSRTYNITCSSPGSSASGSVVVNVGAPPSVNLTANGASGTLTIPYNTSVTISWSSANTTSCAASGDWSGSKPVSGSESTGNLTNSKTYNITCSGPGASASATLVVAVPPPDFNLNSSNDLYATLTFNKEGDSNSTTLTITPFNGFTSNVALSVVSVNPALPSGTTYQFSPATLNQSHYSSGSQFSVKIGAGVSSSRVYTITVQGVDGGLVRTANILLNIQIRNPNWKEF